MTVHTLIQDERRIAERSLFLPRGGSVQVSRFVFSTQQVQSAPAHPRTDALHARPGVAVRPMRGVPRALSSSPDNPTFKDDTR